MIPAAFDYREGSLEDLVEELGDLLFHIIMQSVIGEEEKTFDLADVAREVRNKMIRRHPHIFDRNSGSPIGVSANHSFGATTPPNFRR